MRAPFPAYPKLIGALGLHRWRPPTSASRPSRLPTSCLLRGSSPYSSPWGYEAITLILHKILFTDLYNALAYCLCSSLGGALGTPVACGGCVATGAITAAGVAAASVFGTSAFSAGAGAPARESARSRSVEVLSAATAGGDVPAMPEALPSHLVAATIGLARGAMKLPNAEPPSDGDKCANAKTTQAYPGWSGLPAAAGASGRSPRGDRGVSRSYGEVQASRRALR